MMIAMWIVLLVVVLVMLALDLGVFHRKAHVVTTREALVWTGVWITTALAFNAFVYFAYENHWFGIKPSDAEVDGWTAAVLFFTGYVVEKSLSIDNVFVIALIFNYFGVPPQYQHRVLFWGIVGACVTRAVMILIGAALIARFHWMLYLFGAFLLFTAGRMNLVRAEPDPKHNFLVRFARSILPVTDEYAGQQLTVRRAGKRMLTPLALALVTVESTDVMFAVDSIPAIFAITEDTFLVFSSNIFALFGLRSLYFALAGLMDKFHYLKLTLGVLLALIGLKMLLKDVLHAVPGMTLYTLGTIVLVLAAGIAASLIHAARAGRREHVRPAGM